jgi:uncharacterized protein
LAYSSLLLDPLLKCMPVHAQYDLFHIRIERIKDSGHFSLNCQVHFNKQKDYDLGGNQMELPEVMRDTEKANRILVTGEGIIEARPDTATVILGVSNEVKDLVEGQQQNASMVSTIIHELLKISILPENIQTSDYRIEPVYDYKEGVQTFRGYKITHLLQVRISNLEKIGIVVDTAVKNGANYVSDIRFSASKREGLYKQALTMAVNDAYEKASTISFALKVTLDPTPVSLVEETREARPFTEYKAPMVLGISTTTPIQPGQLFVEARVRAEYRYSH